MLAGLAVFTERPVSTAASGPAAGPASGPAAFVAGLGSLTAGQWAAVGYLAVLVTAVAFLLWYRTVAAVGSGRAGLLTGVAPVAAAGAGMLGGGGTPGPAVWLGLAVVIAGLALGLRGGDARA